MVADAPEPVAEQTTPRRRRERDSWAASHFPRPSPALLGIFAIGLLLCWIRRRTGSLWTCIAAHMLVGLPTAAALLLYGRS